MPASLTREAGDEGAANVQEWHAVGWVPRAHCDSELTVEGQIAWDDVREYPFGVADPEVWECVPLYLGSALK